VNQAKEFNQFWYSDMGTDDTACVYGSNWPWWMNTNEYRASQLFDSEDACCTEHSCDIAPIVQDFESGLQDTESWVHGGTPTHAMDWHITSHKSVSGTHSLRSGDLNGQVGKSSDVTISVKSYQEGVLEFKYYSDVHAFFEHFELQVDGIVAPLTVDAPSGGEWIDFYMDIPEGQHDISFHVIGAATAQTFPRSVNTTHFGTGVFYIDDFRFTRS